MLNFELNLKLVPEWGLNPLQWHGAELSDSYFFFIPWIPIIQKCYAFNLPPSPASQHYMPLPMCPTSPEQWQYSHHCRPSMDRAVIIAAIIAPRRPRFPLSNKKLLSLHVLNQANRNPTSSWYSKFGTGIVHATEKNIRRMQVHGYAASIQHAVTACSTTAALSNLLSVDLIIKPTRIVSIEVRSRNRSKADSLLSLARTYNVG
jgi:hypothetical protein